MDYIRAIERQQIREDIPQVRVADNVKVHYRIKEGDRERIQVFQGDVIRMAGAGARETFTVRKMSFGVGVERTFPLHTPQDRQARGRSSWSRPSRQAVLPPRQGWARLLALPEKRLRRSQRLSTSFGHEGSPFGSVPSFLSDLHARRAWYGQYDELGFGIAGCR